MKELTDKQKAFLEILSDDSNGGDIRKAMNAAGYSPGMSTKMVIESLKDEIIEIARTKLAENSIKASLSLGSILVRPDQLGARNAINAATQILDRVGVVKKEEIIVEDRRAAIVLLPPVDVTE